MIKKNTTLLLETLFACYYAVILYHNEKLSFLFLGIVQVVILFIVSLESELNRD